MASKRPPKMPLPEPHNSNVLNMADAMIDAANAGDVEAANSMLRGIDTVLHLMGNRARQFHYENKNAEHTRRDEAMQLYRRFKTRPSARWAAKQIWDAMPAKDADGVERPAEASIRRWIAEDRKRK